MPDRFTEGQMHDDKGVRIGTLWSGRDEEGYMDFFLRFDDYSNKMKIGILANIIDLLQFEHDAIVEEERRGRK